MHGTNGKHGLLIRKGVTMRYRSPAYSSGAEIILLTATAFARCPTSFTNNLPCFNHPLDHRLRFVPNLPSKRSLPHTSRQNPENTPRSSFHPNKPGSILRIPQSTAGLARFHRISSLLATAGRNRKVASLALKSMAQGYICASIK